MKKRVFTFLAVIGYLFTLPAFAQDDADDFHDVQITIPEIFILDIETSASKTITFTPDATALEAGSPLDFSALKNTDLWLNFTSIKGTVAQTRNITAAITSGTLPAGVSLEVGTTAATGGVGDLGIPVGAAIELNGTAQNLVTGIGSAYTEDGPNKGYNLDYALKLGSTATSFASLTAAANTTVQVTYTITDN